MNHLRNERITVILLFLLTKFLDLIPFIIIFIFRKRIISGLKSLFGWVLRNKRAATITVAGLVIFCLIWNYWIINRPLGPDPPATYAYGIGDGEPCAYFQLFYLWKGGPVWEHDFEVSSRSGEGCGQAFRRQFEKVADHSQSGQTSSAHPTPVIDDYSAIRSSLLSESFTADGTMTDVPGLAPDSRLHVQRVSCTGAKCEKLFVFAGRRAIWSENLEASSIFAPISSLGPGEFATALLQRLPDETETLTLVRYRWDGTTLSRKVQNGIDEPGSIPGEGYRFKNYPGGYMAGELCSRVSTEGLCYSFNWQPWLKELATEVAGEQADALFTDTEVASPGNLVISWDSQRRVVFSGCRAHDCDGASAYFIFAPATKQLDIIWQRDNGVTYLGSDATLLRNAHAYEWLGLIRQ